jgi:L-threonylcarbamoyladenylate synthase
MTPDRYYLDDLLSGDEGSEKLTSVIGKIKQEAVFVYPTDTIYGIGGIATPVVKRRIFLAKRRSLEHPLTLIAGDIGIFLALNLIFDKKAQVLADTFWPGDLTIILSTTGSDEKIGVRVSDHPFIQLMATHLQEPLFSTSANISGEKYINDPDTIYDLFFDDVDMMIDGGKLPVSLPSTVVDASGEKIEIVRQGAVSSEKILSIVE